MASDVSLTNLKVSHCMHHDRNKWNLPFLQSIFEQQIVDHIVQTSLFPSMVEDCLI